MAQAPHRAESTSKMDVAADQQPRTPDGRCREEMDKCGLSVFVITRIGPTVCETCLSREEGAEREEGKNDWPTQDPYITGRESLCLGKLEILLGTTPTVSLEFVNHQGSAGNSPSPWPGAKVVAVWLALGQVSASPWDAALGCDGGREQSGLLSLSTWPSGLAELECPWPALCKHSEVIRR